MVFSGGLLGVYYYYYETHLHPKLYHWASSKRLCLDCWKELCQHNTSRVNFRGGGCGRNLDCDMLVLCDQWARSGEGHGRSWVELGPRERDSGGEETVERRPDEGVSWLIAAGRKCAALYKRY